VQKASDYWCIDISEVVTAFSSAVDDECRPRVDAAAISDAPDGQTFTLHGSHQGLSDDARHRVARGLDIGVKETKQHASVAVRESGPSRCEAVFG
jgi:hypothetical protein